MGRSAPDNSPAGRLLVALCRRAMPSGIDPVDVRALAGADLRRDLLALAARHKVLGLVLSGLGRLDATERQSWEADLAAHGSRLRRRAAMLVFKRDRVLTALGDAGIAAVVLKGAALAPTVYPAPWERDFEDLDLLVPRDQLGRALKALEAVGYREALSPTGALAFRCHHFHVPVVHSDSHYVEIHWALSMPDSPFQLDPEAVYRQAAPSGPGTRPLIPRLEHTLLHIVLQTVQEGFSRLGRVVDLDRIIAAAPQLDWNLIASEARRGGLSSATALALQLAQRLVGAEPPAEGLELLRPSRVTRFHLALFDPERLLLTQSVVGRYAAGLLLEVWLLDGPGRRARWLSRAARASAGGDALRNDPRGMPARLLGVAKLIGLQAWLYARALGGWLGVHDRSQRRFWSSQARSSDFL